VQEICTPGSVGGRRGNPALYPTAFIAFRGTVSMRSATNVRELERIPLVVTVGSDGGSEAKKDPQPILDGGHGRS